MIIIIREHYINVTSIHYLEVIKNAVDFAC